MQSDLSLKVVWPTLWSDLSLNSQNVDTISTAGKHSRLNVTADPHAAHLLQSDFSFLTHPSLHAVLVNFQRPTCD